MTIAEALGCLDDSCDFIEAMIRRHLKIEKREIISLPSLMKTHDT